MDSYVLNPRHDIQAAINYTPIFAREERILMARACEVTKWIAEVWTDEFPEFWERKVRECISTSQ